VSQEDVLCMYRRTMSATMDGRAIKAQRSSAPMVRCSTSRSSHVTGGTTSTAQRHRRSTGIHTFHSSVIYGLLFLLLFVLILYSFLLYPLVFIFLSSPFSSFIIYFLFSIKRFYLFFLQSTFIISIITNIIIITLYFTLSQYTIHLFSFFSCPFPLSVCSVHPIQYALSLRIASLLSYSISYRSQFSSSSFLVKRKSVSVFH